MKKHDQMSSLVGFAFALYVSLESIRKLSLGSWQNPGPGFLPLGAGILMGLLSAAAFLKSVLSTSSEAEEPWFPRRRWKNIALILLALFGYALLLETLGFLACTFALVIFLFRAIEPQRWLVTLGGSALASLICYLIFDVWLKTQLPKGIWGF